MDFKPEKAEDYLKVADQINDVFKAYDLDGNGKISFLELRRVFQLLDPGTSRWSDDNILLMMRGVDRNRDGVVDFNEFIQWICSSRTEARSKKEVLREQVYSVAKDLFKDDRSRFSAFDLNGDRKIDRSELGKMLARLTPHTYSLADVPRLVEECDHDGDGVLSLPEFISLVCCWDANDKNKSILKKDVAAIASEILKEEAATVEAEVEEYRAQRRKELDEATEKRELEARAAQEIADAKAAEAAAEDARIDDAARAARERIAAREAQAAAAPAASPALAPALCAASVRSLAAAAAAPATREERASRLLLQLLSPEVQVLAQTSADDVPAKLSQDKVGQIFIDNVPGVQGFLFRGKAGDYALKYIQQAYATGLPAYTGTALHKYLMCQLRLVVHYGQEKKPRAAAYLREVSEAFMDCQAVQARAIERAGLQIQGKTLDFRGLVVGLVGEYKSMALKMLANERVRQKLVTDDENPTHYENRLTADLGARLGLNADDIRRAELDEHAKKRFTTLGEADRESAAKRCRELFELDDLLKGFIAEVNSFSAESPPDSIPRSFLDWASHRLTQKHIVFDEDTCTRVEIEMPLALAIFEDLFFGRVGASADETYRDEPLCELFEAAL